MTEQPEDASARHRAEPVDPRGSPAGAPVQGAADKSTGSDPVTREPRPGYGEGRTDGNASDALSSFAVPQQDEPSMPPVPQSAPAAMEPPEVRSEKPSADRGSAVPELSGEAELKQLDQDEVHAANAAVLAESRRCTRRAFVTGGVAAAAAYGFYHWLDAGPHRDMLPTAVDRAYDVNATISRDVLREHALAPTYPKSRAEVLRVNGIYGLKKELVVDSYRLQLVGNSDAQGHPRYVPDVTAWEYQYKGKSDGDQGHDTKVDPKLESSAKMAPAPMQTKVEADERHTGRKSRGMEESGESYSTLRPGTPGLLLTVDDVVGRLPRHEFVTQFKCIEGWSQIVQWAGVRMADFLELYPPALIGGEEPRYVYMETPDGDYYVGYDMHVCRHPQTLIVTEMMGAPLTQSHGAPLRMHLPTKYGYKQIKRIGLIAYTNEKPDDYWTKLGYDWYAGL